MTCANCKKDLTLESIKSAVPMAETHKTIELSVCPFCHSDLKSSVTIENTRPIEECDGKKLSYKRLFEGK